MMCIVHDTYNKKGQDDANNEEDGHEEAATAESADAPSSAPSRPKTAVKVLSP